MQYKITSIEEDDEGLDPYILVSTGTDQHQIHALVDSGAHLNTISWDLYQRMRNISLHVMERQFVGFNGTILTTKGSIKLPIYIKGVLCSHNFFVLPPDAPQEQLICGIPWQRKYNVYVD